MSKCPGCGMLNHERVSIQSQPNGGFGVAGDGDNPMRDAAICLHNQLAQSQARVAELEALQNARHQRFENARIETESHCGHFTLAYRWKVILGCGIEILHNHYGWKSAEEAEQDARNFIASYSRVAELEGENEQTRNMLRAMWEFATVEMHWEFFREEFQIDPARTSASAENARKIQAFLASHRDLPAMKELLQETAKP